MIPKIIHYCWFGLGEMPEMAQKCIASWHELMPDYDYKKWDENAFDVNSIPYTKEAYRAGKYAFVSDYVRLVALHSEGGVYLDTDVEVFKRFDDLLGYDAFAGFEGSKYLPVGTCVIASKANGLWVGEMLEAYRDRQFIMEDGSCDLTTNVQFITTRMCERGFVSDGKEREYKDLHVFPVDFFSPRHTTGEYKRTANTYCDHHGMGSWTDLENGWKAKLGRIVGSKAMTLIIKMKRGIFG